MVKYHKNEWYTCDICGSRYDERGQADACEAQGILPVLPIGMIVKMTNESYNKIIFALAAAEGGPGRHYYDPSMWAVRDTGMGHNLPGDGTCGGGGSFKPPYMKAVEEKESWLLRVLVKALHEHGLTPTFWDGKVISFEEFMGRTLEDYLAEVQSP
jgi:hypothetical protein